MKPTCPECGSGELVLVTAGCVRLECSRGACRSSYDASVERLIEACLLSYKDAEEAKS